MYVCMTRAKKKLYLSTFGGKNYRNGTDYTPSIFLAEVFEKIPTDQASQPKPQESPYHNYNAYKGAHRPSLRDNIGGNVNDFLKKAAKSSDEDGSKDTYQVGDKVVHTSYGIGKVTFVYPDGKISVEFNQPYGTKKLAPGFKAFRKMKEGE